MMPRDSPTGLWNTLDGGEDCTVSERGRMTEKLPGIPTAVGERSSGDAETNRSNLPIILCCTIPFLFLVAAYIKMAISYERVWLLDTVVHENGEYTLLDVVFYFRHFSWELLGKAVYSVYLIGAFHFHGRPLAKSDPRTRSAIPEAKIFLSAVFVLALVAATILATASKVGIKETVQGLSQYRTSQQRPPDFGSHWRNHFLSNIVLFSASSFSILLYRLVSDRGRWTRRRFAVLLPLTSAVFVLLTLLFGLTRDPFETPTYLGHQLREIFGTDLPITMLLGMAVLIHLENKYDRRGVAAPRRKRNDVRRSLRYMTAWALPAIAITLYLVFKVLGLDIGGEIDNLRGAEGWSVPDLFAWHFFEHCLDYAFVCGFVYFLYLLTLKAEFKTTCTSA
jgi:hypothetical protein